MGVNVALGLLAELSQKQARCRGEEARRGSLGPAGTCAGGRWVVAVHRVISCAHAHGCRLAAPPARDASVARRAAFSSTRPRSRAAR